MSRIIFIFFLCLHSFVLIAQQPVPIKPRILISTAIGGSDPDDNQSMAHLLMYNDRFVIEGLVSSPSYGNGNKEEILRMIDLYEKDLPKLQKHQKGFATPNYLRSVTKQAWQCSLCGLCNCYRGFWLDHRMCKEEKHTTALDTGVGGLDDLVHGQVWPTAIWRQNTGRKNRRQMESWGVAGLGKTVGLAQMNGAIRYGFW